VLIINEQHFLINEQQFLIKEQNSQVQNKETENKYGYSNMMSFQPFCKLFEYARTHNYPNDYNCHNDCTNGS
jgi:hypothetical protein